MSGTNRAVYKQQLPLDCPPPPPVCVVLCCAVLCCVVLCCVALCCVVLCCVLLCCVVLCRVMLCCVVLPCLALPCVVLHWVVLGCDVLCCAVLCCVVLCCVGLLPLQEPSWSTVAATLAGRPPIRCNTRTRTSATLLGAPIARRAPKSTRKGNRRGPGRGLSVHRDSLNPHRADCISYRTRLTMVMVVGVARCPGST